MTEMDKLAKGLEERNIPFTRRALWGGSQILTDDWDAVCHEFSFGGIEGRLEISGTIVESKFDSSEGWLTAEEVLTKVDKHIARGF